MKQTYYVGSCPHDIPADWYNTDESTYNVLDEVTGAYVLVTTCEECRRENEQAGRIIDEMDIPLDDFTVDFDDTVSMITVFHADGSSEVIEIDESNKMTAEEIQEALDMMDKD